MINFPHDHTEYSLSEVETEINELFIGIHLVENVVLKGLVVFHYRSKHVLIQWGKILPRKQGKLGKIYCHGRFLS